MPSPKTRAEVVAISNRVADEWKIPRLLMLAVGVAESNLRWDARRPADPKDDERFWADVSGGVWQQTVRYDPEYAGGGTYPGASEIARILERQYDVERSAHVAAANLKAKLSLERGDPLTAATDDEIMRAAHRYNWPGGGGRPYSPAHEENYRRGLAEAKTLIPAREPPMTVPPFDPSVRVDAQPDSWSCSIQSAEWFLRSVGRNPSDQWIQDALLGAGVVTREQGLMDASGQQLADWLTANYGNERGWQAQASPVTFDDVWAGAGQNPMLIGGRAWNHWSGVRGRHPDGTLSLANPANGWKGVGQSMSRAQFDALGPFTCVWLDRGAVPVTPPAPQPSRAQTLVSEIEARLAELKTLVA